MKIFKKLATFLAVGAMSVSAFAFTACEPASPNGPSGSGNGSGNAALINGVREQKYDFIVQSLASETNVSGKSFSLNEDGTKGAEIADSAYTAKTGMTQSGKINLADGNADISAVQTSEAGGQKSSEYTYSFMRNWNLFEYVSEEETEDFSGVTLDYYGNVSGQLPDTVDGLIELSDIAEQGLGTVNYLLLTYGDNFGGLTVAENKATLDLSKTLYNMVQSLKTLVEGIKDDTTVGGVLADETVKKLLTPVLDLIEPAQIIAAVSGVLSPESELGQILAQLEIDVADILGEPAEGETSYEYLTRLIGSEKLSNAINTVLAAMAEMQNAQAISLPATLDKVPVSFFATLMNTDLDALKATVGELAKSVTAASVTTATVECYVDIETGYRYYEGEDLPTDAVLVPETSTTTLKNVKVEYTLDGNTVTAQKISLGTEADDGTVRYKYDDDDTAFKLEEESAAGSYTVELSYVAKASELKDISKCATVEYASEYQNLTLTVQNVWSYTEEDTENESVKYYNCDFADEIVLRAVVDENDEVLGCEYKKAGEPDTAYKTLGETVELKVTAVNFDDETDVKELTLTFAVELDSNRVTIENEETDFYSQYYFYTNSVEYTNTVEGILAGTPGVKA